MKTTTPRHLRLAFVSSCLVEWGGSEELWAGTALWLARAGHSVQAFKTNVNAQQPQVRALRAAGCPVTELAPAAPLLRRIASRLRPYRPAHELSQQRLRKGLQSGQPQLVLISQGGNYDGHHFAAVCRQLKLPYVLLAQKASDNNLPPHQERTLVQQSYQSAHRAFFVSRHNLLLTQLQLGLALPAAEVVWNPYNVAFQGEAPWPAAPNGILQLACVARLYLADKGQDLLLQVLTQARWRQRPLHLTLYGAGPDEAAIRGMIAFLGLQTRVSLGGYQADIARLWRQHHALVLPSRHEGLPLALVEAMLSGRPAIATDAGGIAELLTDGETGFLAAAPTFQALDEALERAWLARASWPQLGAEAARQARASVPPDAAARLAQRLLLLAQGTPTTAAPVAVQQPVGVS